MSSFTFPLFSQEWDKWEFAKRQTALVEEQTALQRRETKALEKIASTPLGDSSPVRYFQPDTLYRQDTLVADCWASSDIEDAIREAAEINLLGQERIAQLLTWVRSDLSRLQEELVAGMDQIHDCLVHGFNQLVTALEVTNYTLQHPLGTQASEYKERGKKAYEHGLRFTETERKRWMEDSESDLRAALELNKYDFEVWYLLGMILGYERGDLDAAKAAFDNTRHYAEPLDAKTAACGARQCGAIASGQKDYAAAVSGYEKALSLNPGDPTLKFELAHVLLEGEDPQVTERAIQLLIESVEQEPNLWALAFTDPTFQKSAACIKQLDQLRMQLQDKILPQLTDLRHRFEEARQNLPLNWQFIDQYHISLRRAQDVLDRGGYSALREVESSFEQRQGRLLDEVSQAEKMLIDKINSDLHFLLKGLGWENEFLGSSRPPGYRNGWHAAESIAPGAYEFFQTFLGENRAQLVSMEMASRIEKEVKPLRVVEKLHHPGRWPWFQDEEIQKLKWLFEEIWHFVDLSAVEGFSFTTTETKNLFVAINHYYEAYRSRIASKSEHLPWRDGKVREFSWPHPNPNCTCYHRVDALSAYFTEYWMVRVIKACVQTSIVIRVYALLKEVG